MGPNTPFGGSRPTKHSTALPTPGMSWSVMGTGKNTPHYGDFADADAHPGVAASHQYAPRPVKIALVVRPINLMSYPTDQLVTYV
jgi:hypothetical protein